MVRIAPDAKFRLLYATQTQPLMHGTAWLIEATLDGQPICGGIEREPVLYTAQGSAHFRISVQHQGRLFPEGANQAGAGNLAEILMRFAAPRVEPGA